MSARLKWRDTNLYRVLADTFPTYRTTEQKVFDIESLARDIEMSEEGVYKWFRAGRILSHRGVERLFELANRPNNVAALKAAGREPPTRQELAALMLP